MGDVRILFLVSAFSNVSRSARPQNGVVVVVVVFFDDRSQVGLDDDRVQGQPARDRPRLQEAQGAPHAAGGTGTVGPPGKQQGLAAGRRVGIRPPLFQGRRRVGSNRLSGQIGSGRVTMNGPDP